jgi:hypothetical protein
VYTERSDGSLWLSMIFKFIKPMLNEAMKQKVGAYCRGRWVRFLLLCLGCHKQYEDAHSMIWWCTLGGM